LSSASNFLVDKLWRKHPCMHTNVTNHQHSFTKKVKLEHLHSFNTLCKQKIDAFLRNKKLKLCGCHNYPKTIHLPWIFLGLWRKTEISSKELRLTNSLSITKPCNTFSGLFMLLIAQAIYLFPTSAALFCFCTFSFSFAPVLSIRAAVLRSVNFRLVFG